MTATLEKGNTPGAFDEAPSCAFPEFPAEAASTLGSGSPASFRVDGPGDLISDPAQIPKCEADPGRGMTPRVAPIAEELWAPLALALAATFAAWWGLRRWLGDVHRAGLLASLAVALFYTIEQWQSVAQRHVDLDKPVLDLSPYQDTVGPRGRVGSGDVAGS